MTSVKLEPLPPRLGLGEVWHPRRAEPYIAWHYDLPPLPGALTDRAFVTPNGEQLSDVAAIRKAFKRDWLVCSVGRT